MFNNHVSIVGVYELPEIYMRAATGLSSTIIQRAKEKFMDDGKLTFFGQWVRIVNFEKYQNYAGERNDVAKEKILSSAPKELFDDTRRLSIDTERLNRDSVRLHSKQEIRNTKQEIQGGSRGELSTLADASVIAELSAKFPRVNVAKELEKMRDWLAAKGRRQRDYVAFARNWLRRAEESAPSRYVGPEDDYERLRKKSAKYTEPRKEKP